MEDSWYNVSSCFIVQVFVMVIYILMLYMIFQHLSRNIAFLPEELQHIEYNGVQIMRTTIHTKYIMFKYGRCFFLVCTIEVTHNEFKLTFSPFKFSCISIICNGYHLAKLYLRRNLSFNVNCLISWLLFLWYLGNSKLQCS